MMVHGGEVPRGGEQPIPGDISVPDRHAPAATVIDVPPEPRVEFQAEGAATFTEDGAQFRRQMARGDPLELHATSKVSIGSDGSSDISTGVECKDGEDAVHVTVDSNSIDDDTSDDEEDDVSVDNGVTEIEDEEWHEVQEEKRPRSRRNLIACIGTVIIIMAVLGKHGFDMIHTSMQDGRWYRCWNFISYPWLMFVGYFAFYVIVSTVLSILGPVRFCNINTEYCSTVPPPPWKGKGPLPRLTIQVPVYKESFDITLKPTLLSILDACWKYELQGGKTNIIIYDDGLDVISQEERRIRKYFYRKYRIAYVARPGSGRKGRFKKGSNLNFGMNLGLEIDRRVAAQGGKMSHKAALKELKEESNHVFKATGSLHLSEFLLLIDSDTRIPEDSFLPILTELRAAPHVAFAQCLTYPMQQVHNYWENAISHFTRMVNAVAILVACSGGDPAPLVGHNVFLRWSHMKEVAVPNEEECQWKFWSEDCVSEDFDYSMRVQAKGYIGRYLCYTNDWLEGVSLTVHDEIARFKKYSFGAAEMLFNPIREWPWKGLLSKVFWRYLTCKYVPVPGKIAVTAYLGTYFAIASSPVGCLVNYFAYHYSKIYRDEVLSVIDIMAYSMFVFSILCPVGVIATKYRLGLKWSVWDEVKHTFSFLIFFSGLGYHLLVAMVCHMFSLDLSFGVTRKEIQKTNFFKEVRETIRSYWVVYLWCLAAAAVMIGCWLAPEPYQIRNVYSVFPLFCIVFFHIVAPVWLNPVLMLVQW